MSAAENRGGEVSRGFLLGLSAVLGIALAHRAAYVWAQPLTDPAFARPMLDGAYYLEWARSLAAGGDGPAGAFYLAPLYPYVLAGFLEVFGERFSLLYLLQHVLSVGTAGLLGLVCARRSGARAGLATATLCAFYAPAVFFASRPLGETLAVFLLVLSLWQVERATLRSAAAGGALVGLAALGRPNWLPLPALWALGELRRPRHPRRAAWILGAAVLVVLPVTVRNYARTGHLVPVSSNGGITFYHGNGVGAAGTYTAVPGVTGNVAASDRLLSHQSPEPASEEGDTQREQATSEAVRISGRALDAVQADGWWGKRALEVRLQDPAGSLRLLLRRAFLLIDSTEHSLDYNPRLDANPWRATLHLSTATGDEIPIVPFALILGFSAAGLYLFGFSGSGGWRVWAALGMCLMTPLVFYVSSRYRLPFAALLTVPAGTGLVGLLARGSRSVSQRVFAASVGGACALLSLALVAPEDANDLASGLNNRAIAYFRVGELAAAERDFRQAVEMQPYYSDAHASLGHLLHDSGRTTEAIETMYEAVRRSPGSCRAVHILAAVLIDDKRPADAIAPLREFLGRRQDCRPAWIDLIVSLSLIGDQTGALEVAEGAKAARFELPKGLLDDVRALAEASEGTGR